MTREELQELLNKHEWKDVEFKASQRGVSNSAYETVSAFANTSGGWLVFGVRQDGSELEVVGVIEVDKVQNDFLSVLRGTQKLNRTIEVKEDLGNVEEKTLLIFYIPESPRSQKPIYLNGDIRHSYIRRGAGDEKCKDFEIERFLRDSGGVPHDSQLIEDVPVDACFDEEVVQWYRGAFGRRNPGRHEALSNLAFLNEWGFTGEKDGKLLPTRAGILVFGTGKYVRQVLIRPVVDYQRIDYPVREWTPELRWSDRLTVEENLVRAWWGLAERSDFLSSTGF